MLQHYLIIAIRNFFKYKLADRHQHYRSGYRIGMFCIRHQLAEI